MKEKGRDGGSEGEREGRREKGREEGFEDCNEKYQRILISVQYHSITVDICIKITIPSRLM